MNINEINLPNWYATGKLQHTFEMIKLATKLLQIFLHDSQLGLMFFSWAFGCHVVVHLA